MVDGRRVVSCVTQPVYGLNRSSFIFSIITMFIQGNTMLLDMSMYCWKLKSYSIDIHCVWDRCWKEDFKGTNLSLKIDFFTIGIHNYISN